MSDLFQNAVANLTQATIELYDTDGAQGAARGAGIGYGYYDQSSAFEGLELLKRIEPSNKNQDAYSAVYNRWKACLEQALQ